MIDFESRHMIEALRSGVPSRSVGKFFSSSRKEIMDKAASLISSSSEGVSNSMVIKGKYGEGKTHFLNSVFSMAQENNMVVSFVALGKETPANKIDILYKRVLEQTYLPGESEPGIPSLFTFLSSGSDKANEMFLYALNKLDTNRLYYVLKAFLASEGSNDDEVDVLEADLQGAFASVAAIRSLYSKYCREKVSLNNKFVIKEHTSDYFAFMSHLFKVMGYSGWVILFDEAELIGRFARKSRMAAYSTISKFLFPPSSFDSVSSIFAFSSSYTEEVIGEKDDYGYLDLMEGDEESKRLVKSVLDRIVDAEELRALTEDELTYSLKTIVEIYSKAYGKDYSEYADKVIGTAMSSGYLLRTKIRAAIEALDQISQYGDEGDIFASTVCSDSLSDTLDQLLDFDN